MLNYVNKALSINSTINSKHSNEIRSHLRQTIKCIEKIQKSEGSKNKSQQHTEWWNNVKSGLVNLSNTSMSRESQINGIKKLNSLIEKEQNFLDQITPERSNYPQKINNEKLITE